VRLLGQARLGQQRWEALARSSLLGQRQVAMRVCLGRARLIGGRKEGLVGLD
jgi:hypothetical protein